MNTSAPCITDISADLHDAGWQTVATRTRGTQAVVEYARRGRKVWALVDTRTNDVIGGTAVREVRAAEMVRESEYRKRVRAYRTLDADARTGTDWERR
ncbi:hypothetical protein SEA_ZELINK_230 [Mycobacterium phage Zelink]|nr:hypothetical protein SEA_ZELINK_230 [Mycobacterium phage Zelink]